MVLAGIGDADQPFALVLHQPDATDLEAQRLPGHLHHRLADAILVARQHQRAAEGVDRLHPRRVLGHPILGPLPPPQVLHAPVQFGRCGLGRAVVQIVAHLRADHDRRMDPQHVQEKVGREPTTVVLADRQALAFREELPQFRLVFDQSLGAGLPPQRPGHLAGDAQGAVPLRQRPLRLRPQESDHPVRIEEPVAKIDLTAGGDDQLSPLEERPGVQPIRPEAVQGGVHGLRIDDDEDLLTPLQPPLYEGGKYNAALFLCLVEVTEVVTRPQILNGGHRTPSPRPTDGRAGGAGKKDRTRCHPSWAEGPALALV